MILRKPYAFLIKNFRKIHLLMMLFMAYVGYSSNNILKFFNHFIETGTFNRSSFSLSAQYISIFLIISTILVIAISSVIYVLMKQKNKPRLFYIIIIAYYVILIGYFIYMYGTFDTLEISSLSSQGLRIVRDVTSVVTYVQYGLIILIAVRAFGFNIKKFNFGEDLQELEIEARDNEEFELTVGIDREKISRGIRRGKRELKYFFVENMFILTSIIVTSSILIVVTLLLNFKVYNKVYYKNSPFSVGNFVVTLHDAHYTTINQKGESIAPKGITYVVLTMSFTNKNTFPHNIDLKDIIIKVDEKNYSPKTNRYMSFIDLGEGYTDQKIASGETKEYILVFEVDDSINFNKVILNYRESLTIKNNEIKGKYKRIKIDGKHINDIKTIKTVKLGEKLKFEKSKLNNTNLTISEIETKPRFTYQAVHCYNNSCNDYENILTLDYSTIEKTIMRISYDYVKDSNNTLNNSKTFIQLINYYGSIRYKIGNKYYISELDNITPRDYNGKDLYYQVSSNLSSATAIELVIRIRDKEYIYKLK